MASINTRPSGARSIQFSLPRQKRRTIRLGKVSLRIAESWQNRIETLIACHVGGLAIDGPTAEWLARLDSDTRDKLAAYGLITPEGSGTTRNGGTLGEFLSKYIAGRTDVKPLSTQNYQYARRELVGYFGADKPLGDITKGDADAFRIYLRTKRKKPLGEQTARNVCKKAKMFFRAAQRLRLIAENPFGDMKQTTVKGNRERFYFVTRADAERVLQACPTNEWRLIFALSRFAGVRCPSETLRLTWGDVDLEAGRMTVASPKTEHHEGHASRIVPLFPELRPYIEAAYSEAQAAVGDDTVPPASRPLVVRYRDPGQNLRTTFEKIIKRAGVTPWPKLFHNLRATRQTELAQDFPQHVVCAWLGNSEAVATEHYLRVTDADLARAIGDEKRCKKRCMKCTARRCKGLQA